MTVAGVKTARAPERSGRSGGRPGARSGGRSGRPVVVARITLAAPSAPPLVDDPVGVPPSRRDLHVARRLRRRDAMAGLGVLAATLLATVAVLDMLH